MDCAPVCVANGSRKEIEYHRRMESNLKGTIRVGTRLVELPNSPGAKERIYKVVAKFKLRKGAVFAMFTLAHWMPRKRRYSFRTESETMLRAFWARPAKVR
jgi:hypothetical protein